MTVSTLPPNPRRPGRSAVLAQNRQAVPLERSLRVAAAMGGPIILAVMYGNPSVGALGSIGALMAPLIGPWTYPQRARRLPALAVIMGLSFALGQSLAEHPYAAAIVIGLWAGLAVLAAGLAGEWASPFAAIAGVVCIIGSGFDAGGQRHPWAPLVVALGGLWVAVVFNLGRRSHRWQPETSAVQQAFGTVADYVAAVGTPDADALRLQARRAILNGWEAVGLPGAEHGGGPTGLRLRAMLLQAQRLLDACVSLAAERADPLPGDLADAVRALALTVDDPQLAAFLRIPAAPVGAPRRLRQCYALAEETRSAAARDRPDPDAHVAPLRLTARDRIHELPEIRAVQLRTAARLGLTVAAASAISWAAPGEHNYWIVVTALIVLRSDPAGTNVRAAQRALGTVLGVGLAGGVLLARPTAQVAALAMVATAYLMPAALARSYLLGSAARTGYALLLIEAGDPSRFTGQVMLERVLDTALGAAVAVAAAVLLWPFAATRRLPGAVADCLTTMAAMVRDAVGGQPMAKRSRRLVLYLFGLRNLFDQAVGERKRRWPDTEAFWPVVVVTLRMGGPTRLAVEPVPGDETRPLLTPRGVQQLGQALDDLAAAIARGAMPPPLPWSPNTRSVGLFALAEELHRAAARCAADHASRSGSGRVPHRGPSDGASGRG